MAAKEIALEVASFLDSPEAKALTKPSPGDVRKIVEAFVSVCYDDLGLAPRLMDGQDMYGALGHVLPGHFERKSPLVDHVPAVLRAYVEHLCISQVVPQPFELRRGFEETIDEFIQTVRTGENPHGHHHGHAHKKDAPLVHQAPKLGRNDPCFCGSGKKFKKCCG
jgi:hypothetical protein